MTDFVQTSRRLESYLCGDWLHGNGEATALLDAATGDEIAMIDATGLDFAGALDYGRTTGGPKLRAMTFHERASMLRALGQALMAVKEEFYQESFHTGATRTDSWIDIDGGIGTLLAFASKARRELPDTHVLTEGDVEPLSKNASFSAQHILTPMEGIAVHINAFNFPVWGMLEKIAPTLLAGVPSIVKPASQTAYLTELVVGRIIQTGLLPEGALQLVCGSAGDMLDHVTEQDIVTFTGSATTGRQLKTCSAVVNNSVRFNMEADSLNAAVLGADAVLGTEEFDLFIREVVHEMTVKTGQKCTAIRRIIVPRAHCDVVAAAISERLGKIVIGHPNAEGTSMGPLASLGQRNEVRARIDDLKAVAQIVAGEPDRMHLSSGSAERGAFIAPVLLYCDQPFKAATVHDVEAFGPVATLMPYNDADEAVALVRRGRGSLVASVWTDSPEIAREMTISMASCHGRILIGNRRSAKSSTGHGSPLAPLVHGGPGRAGGGEEMGGMRGIKHYMQRTAIQATPYLLSAVTGRWMEGATTTQDGTHPFRKSLGELKVGEQLVTAERMVTLEDIEHFAGFTGDNFYAHMDDDTARANPFFEGRVAHGYLVLSFAAGLFVEPEPGPVLANYGVDHLRFLTPVNPGDTLKVRLTCKEINPRENADYGEVRWDCQVTNQNTAVVAQYDVLTMVAKNWPF